MHYQNLTFCSLKFVSKYLNKNFKIGILTLCVSYHNLKNF